MSTHRLNSRTPSSRLRTREGVGCSGCRRIRRRQLPRRAVAVRASTAGPAADVEKDAPGHSAVQGHPKRVSGWAAWAPVGGLTPQCSYPSRVSTLPRGVRMRNPR